MKKINNKKIIILVVGIVAILCCTLSGTIAWLTSTTDPVVNTFTYGDINIEISETDTNDGDNDVNTNIYEMVPGNEITKDPIITVSANSEDCYLFIQLDKSTNFDQFLTYTLEENWISLDGYENVYYQEVSKDTNKQTFNVLKDNKVIVKEEVTKRMLNELDKDGVDNYPTLSVTAYAVQRDSEIDAIDTALEAWNLINSQA